MTSCFLNRYNLYRTFFKKLLLITLLLVLQIYIIILVLCNTKYHKVWLFFKKNIKMLNMK